MTEPFPFEDLLGGIVADARRELTARRMPEPSLVMESALKDLERGLLRSVSNLLSQVLELQFSLFRLLEPLPGAPSRDPYERYVQKIVGEGLDFIWEQYPPLETSLKRVTSTWVDSSAEFLFRLQCDARAIQETFNGGREMGSLAGLQTDVSDRHGGGRTVCIGQFSSGVRIVYKPKDVGPEGIFYDTLLWLNSTDIPLQFSVPLVLERSEYGWVEFVEQKSCTDDAGIHRYYGRAGQLACILFALCASDCHFGNIIGCGEYPMLIDAETLFQPVALSATAAAQGRTALSTGLLPSRSIYGVEVSGLGARQRQMLPFRIAKWTNINSGTMKLTFTPGQLAPPKSLPSLDGNACPVWEYVDDVLDGFGRMYRALLQSREALLANSGPLEPMREQAVRFLLRDSHEYYFAINRSLHLNELRGKRELDIQLHPLAAARGMFDTFMPFERAELQRLDIPRYIAAANSRNLKGCGYSMSDAFHLSGYDHVIQTVKRLSKEDLRQQTELIRWSLLFARPQTGAG